MEKQNNSMWKKVIGKFIIFSLSKIIVNVGNLFYLISVRGIFIYGAGIFNVQKVIGKFINYFLSKIAVMCRIRFI